MYLSLPSVPSAQGRPAPTFGLDQLPTLFSVPNFLSTVGLLPLPGFLPSLSKAACYSKDRNQTHAPRSQLWEGGRAPLPFTEVSGFVLSALASENLCLYVCV